MRLLVEASEPEVSDRVKAGPALVETDPTDLERRLEDWLVSYLDDSDPQEQQTDWREVLESGSLLPRGPQTQVRRGQRRKLQRRLWTRLSVVRRKSISLIRLLDANLIKDDVILELADELRDVLRAGANRIILDFSNVERMSSQILGIVGEIHRRCASSYGGMLRLCGLKSSLAEVFTLAGLDTTLAIYPDEPMAYSSPWPASDWARPLPVSILSALSGSSRQPSAEAIESNGVGANPLEQTAVPGPERSQPSVHLVVEKGSRKGSIIPVRGDRFLIGRDEQCHLRCVSSRVSLVHAVVERRGEVVVIRDLGAAQGTVVNGDTLHDDERVLVHRDRITIGSLALSIRIERVRGVQDLVDELVSSWMAEDSEPEADSSENSRSGEFEARVLLDANEQELDSFRLRYAVIQDVLVVIPLAERLDEDAAIDRLRCGLFDLSQRPLPRRVVLDLSQVSHLSSRAIGMLLAHFLRLDRLDGSLRLCRLNDRLLSLLEQVRLPMLLETYAGVDEAVLTAWS